MNPSLLNRQSRARLRLPKLRALARRLLRLAAAEAPAGPWARVGLVFTDDPGIIPINRACFDKPRPTDVISVAYAETPGGGRGPTAEVFVNVEQAIRRAGPGRAGQAELALYLAHGLHHLAGAVDGTPAARRAMLRRERAWLREAAREGLLEGLWSNAR